MIDPRVQRAYDELLAEGVAITHALLRQRAGVAAHVASEGLREIRHGRAIDAPPAAVVEAAVAAVTEAWRAGANSASLTVEVTDTVGPATLENAPLTDLVPGLREIQFIREDGAPIVVPMSDDEVPVLNLEGRLRAAILRHLND